MLIVTLYGQNTFYGLKLYYMFALPIQNVSMGIEMFLPIDSLPTFNFNSVCPFFKTVNKPHYLFLALMLCAIGIYQIGSQFCHSFESKFYVTWLTCICIDLYEACALQ